MIVLLIGDFFGGVTGVDGGVTGRVGFETVLGAGGTGAGAGEEETPPPLVDHPVGTTGVVGVTGGTL